MVRAVENTSRRELFYAQSIISSHKARTLAARGVRAFNFESFAELYSSMSSDITVKEV